VKRIGVDIDDVLMPWADTAHGICEAAGITNGATITHWEFWKDYGCDPQTVWDLLDHATVHGGLYDAAPYDGAADALQRLTDAGHTVHLVTARGFLANGPLIRQLTCAWLDQWSIPHDSLTFATDKRVVPVDHFIDDSLRNYDQLDSAGVDVHLLTRSHNQVTPCHRRRVDSLAQFVELVIA
jgi:hypothetical protein